MFKGRLTPILTRGLFVWIIIMAVETIHGIARTMLVEPVIGSLRARQVSVFSGSILILGMTFVFVRWLKGMRVSDYVLVGIVWVLLTVGFEVGIGRLVMGLSWDRIGSDFNVMTGGLMPLGLLVMLFAPLAMAKFVDEV